MPFQKGCRAKARAGLEGAESDRDRDWDESERPCARVALRSLISFRDVSDLWHDGRGGRAPSLPGLQTHDRLISRADIRYMLLFSLQNGGLLFILSNRWVPPSVASFLYTSILSPQRAPF